MSADNWAQCPKCKMINESKAYELDAKVLEAYGKKDPMDFLKLRDEALTFRTRIKEDGNFTETLREDYSIGIQDGEFSVGYRAGCATCGFSFSYNYETPIEVTL